MLPRHAPPLTWRNPEATVEALLLIPDRPTSGNAPLRLNLYRVDSGGAAVELGQRSVSLAGVERRLDERAHATFTLQELHDAGQDALVLEVDGQPWAAQPAT